MRCPNRSSLPTLSAATVALACAALWAPLAWGQTAAPVPPAAVATTPAPSERIERITHEDSLSRIDELRVGGQTRSIEVKPKNGAPAYDIEPARGGEDLSEGWGQRGGSAGKSRWRILDF